MPSYKLIYFNVRGRCETIRLAFVAGGIKFEDKRIERADWGALKPTTPWGSLPILEVDGRTLGQSISLARFAATEGGLMGKNNIEAALINSVVDVITEIREKAIGVHVSPEGPAKDAAAKDFKEKTLASSLPNLEKFLAANPDHSGFFVGTKLSLADLHFYAITEGLIQKVPEILSGHSTLKTLFDRVGETPKIAEYLKTRPVTPM